MTRYARSAGATGQSKGIHTATPWSLLKPKKTKDNKNFKTQEKLKSFKKKKDFSRVLDEPLTLPLPKPAKGGGPSGIAAEIESVPQPKENSKKSKLKKNKALSKEQNEVSDVRQTMDQIKNDFKKEGKSLSEKEETEMQHLVKKVERSEKRRKKRADERESQKVCFKCRETGHDMSSCPSLKKDSGTGICFKCGSTEHGVNQCKAKLPPGEFPFAKCFICGENGHLSKQCPDNPRGLYPNGGCCKFCGSVEHFKSSCPEMLKEQGIQDLKLHLWTGASTSADDDLMLDDDKPKIASKAKLKVVKF